LAVHDTRKPTDEKRFVVRFLAAFFLLYIAIHATDYALPGLLYPLKRLVALSLVPLLSAVGITATAQGTAVVAGAAKYAMAIECTGLVMVALLASALYASEMKPKTIARALVFYAPFLFAFNIARVLFAVWAETALGAGAFDPAHALTWLADSAVVVLVWYRVTVGWDAG
jgi:exosortase/archaeosortase family protein